jgi:hypothetical protein
LNGSTARRRPGVCGLVRQPAKPAATAKTPHVRGQVACALVSVLRILAQTPIDDSGQRTARIVRQVVQRLVLVLDDRRDHRRSRVALERPPPAQHLVDDGPEGELVCTVVDRPARRLFR